MEAGLPGSCQRLSQSHKHGKILSSFKTHRLLIPTKRIKTNMPRRRGKTVPFFEQHR